MGVLLEIPRAIFEAKAKREKARQPRPAPAGRKTSLSKDQNMRRGLLAKVHVAKRQLGLSDEEWRALLEARFQVDSSGLLGTGELTALVGYLERMGWEPSTPRTVRDSHGTPHILKHDDAGMHRERQVGKIEALLAELGRFDGRYVPWAYAAAILKRQCGVTRLEWASPEQLTKVIAALNKTLSRKMRTANG